MPIIDKELLNKIIKKTGGSKPKVYRDISSFAGPRHLAAGALAQSLKINIQKYYSEEELTKISQLKTNSVLIQNNKNKAAFSKIKLAKTPKMINEVQKVISQRIINEALKNTSPYQKLYWLENSIRERAKELLTKKYGNNWWTANNTQGKPIVHADIKKNVKSRKDGENSAKWVSRRANHELFYTDFKDLKTIILNNWDQFKLLSLTQNKLLTLFDDLEPIRNIVAHNNPLGDTDSIKVEMHLTDWCKVVVSPQ